MTEALRLLGLEPGASPAEIRAAYRRRSITCHPDHGGTVEAFDALKKAATAAESQAMEEPCPSCHGKGKVNAGRGWHVLWQTCPNCLATGKRYQ